MESEKSLPIGTLSAKLIRVVGENPDGTNIYEEERNLGVISEGPILGYINEAARYKAAKRKWRIIGWIGVLGIIAGICVLGGWVFGLLASLIVFGIVTNAGVAYEAATFAGGASTSLFNFHDSGTGVTAAAVTDTTLQTPAGGARVAGAQASAANVYQTIATITYAGGFAITEWGLFSAAAAGTLWDRRVFGAITVVATNAIQFTYQCTFPSGGS